jgi:hypothetical protein
METGVDCCGELSRPKAPSLSFVDFGCFKIAAGNPHKTRREWRRVRAAGIENFLMLAESNLAPADWSAGYGMRSVENMRDRPVPVRVCPGAERFRTTLCGVYSRPPTIQTCKSRLGTARSRPGRKRGNDLRGKLGDGPSRRGCPHHERSQPIARSFGNVTRPF